jgi:hypothetical protein
MAMGEVRDATARILDGTTLEAINARTARQIRRTLAKRRGAR